MLMRSFYFFSGTGPNKKGRENDPNQKLKQRRSLHLFVLNKKHEEALHFRGTTREHVTMRQMS